MTREELMKFVNEYDEDERIFGALCLYHFTQYQMLEGMEEDNYLTSLSDPEDEECSPRKPITMATFLMWQNFLEKDVTITTGDTDVVLAFVHPICNVVCEQYHLDINGKAMGYLSAVVAATFCLLFERMEVDDIIDMIIRKDFTISSIDPEAAYHRLRSYGFTTSDIFLFYNHLKHSHNKDIDEQIEFGLRSQQLSNKIIETFTKVFLPQVDAIVEGKDANLIKLLASADLDFAKEVYLFAAISYGIIPRGTDMEKLSHPDMLDQFFDLFASDKLTKKITPQNKSAVYALFRYALGAQQFIESSGMKGLGFSQGCIFEY